MKWYCVFLDEHRLARREQDCLVRQFQALYERVGNEDMALFSASHPGHGMDLYFSPESVQVARGLIDYYGGQPSSPPPLSKVHTLVGHQGARERLLGEQAQQGAQ